MAKVMNDWLIVNSDDNIFVPPPAGAAHDVADIEITKRQRQDLVARTARLIAQAGKNPTTGEGRSVEAVKAAVGAATHMEEEAEAVADAADIDTRRGGRRRRRRSETENTRQGDGGGTMCSGIKNIGGC